MCCGLNIGFDAIDGNAAVRSSEFLAGEIGSARGVLFGLSDAWNRSTWCKNEYEVSLSEQRMCDGFEIVGIRLDDVEPPRWFSVAEIIDMRQPNIQSVSRLLGSLGSDLPHRFDNAGDVYLAAPWSRPSSLTRIAFEALREIGWRLVGDTPTFKHLGERRIAAIQRTTRGVVAILPHEPAEANGQTSKYILEEARLALTVGKPLLLLAEPGVEPATDILKGAFRAAAVPLGSTAAQREELLAALQDFDEHLQRTPHDDTGAFIFLAASLRGDLAEMDGLTAVIERSSNMRCVRGERLSGDNVQTAIVDLIRRAAVVIAEVSDDHRNTLIEAGIAIGSGTRLKLMCREPRDGTPVKKRFMFEGQEFFWYKTPEERVGLCYYFARQFRRRIYVLR